MNKFQEQSFKNLQNLEKEVIKVIQLTKESIAKEGKGMIIEKIFFNLIAIALFTIIFMKLIHKNDRNSN